MSVRFSTYQQQALLSSALCFIAFLMLLVSPVSLAADKPLVFVSVSPQKYLLQKIAGDQVNIEVLVQPGHNPHSYDPSARQMARLAKAQMLMTTGVPFEQVWLPRISRLNSEMRLVDTLAGSASAKAAYISRHDHHEDQPHDHEVHSSHDEHSHDHESHNHEGLDPHIWMDPMKALSQARIMTDALKELRPEAAEIFEQGYLSLASELKTLDHEVHELLEPYEGRTFMVFHPAWGHFAARYHLKQIAIEYQGKSPSARQLVRLSETAKAENIRVILVQEQFNQKPAERIAENIGARVVKADPLPENLPKAIRKLSEQLLESWH
ncbi:metal ABC transporter solute-binding protein, Zn/Mn family [Oceanospirillum sp.]|uniref:metal ABC transporter solute-binding protein, Zn/Mn family n=1 Tax=Oceanospirillum sp. TaxID=2021254 RepID=UPI003A9395C8